MTDLLEKWRERFSGMVADFENNNYHERSAIFSIVTAKEIKLLLDESQNSRNEIKFLKDHLEATNKELHQLREKYKNHCECTFGKFDETGWCDNCGGEHLQENFQKIAETKEK